MQQVCDILAEHPAISIRMFHEWYWGFKRSPNQKGLSQSLRSRWIPGIRYALPVTTRRPIYLLGSFSSREISCKLPESAYRHSLSWRNRFQLFRWKASEDRARNSWTTKTDLVACAIRNMQGRILIVLCEERVEIVLGVCNESCFVIVSSFLTVS